MPLPLLILILTTIHDYFLHLYVSANVNNDLEGVHVRISTLPLYAPTSKRKGRFRITVHF